MLSVIRQRRSIRLFQDKKVEPDKIKNIIDSALLAPSSKGNNPWQFVLVDDPDLLKKLSDAREYGSKFIAKAPLVITILADPRETSVWVEDSSIAASFIMLAARHLNLGSCWVQIRDRFTSQNEASEEYVKGLLKIPKDLRVLCLIAIGYPDEVKPEKELPLEKLKEVFLNRYGKSIVFNDNIR